MSDKILRVIWPIICNGCGNDLFYLYGNGVIICERCESEDRDYTVIHNDALQALQNPLEELFKDSESVNP